MFEIKGASQDSSIDFICTLADQAVDGMVEASEHMKDSMDFKAFTLMKVHKDEEQEKARFLQLTDVLQGALLRSMERYREECSKLKIRYGYEDDAESYDIWLHVAHE